MDQNSTHKTKTIKFLGKKQVKNFTTLDWARICYI